MNTTQATSAPDLVDEFERRSKRDQFEEEFFKIHEGRPVCLATVAEMAAFRDGNIEFFKRQLEAQAFSIAQWKAGVAAGDKDGAYSLSDLKNLEDRLEQIIREKRRFREQLSVVVAELRELDRREHASKKALAEAESMTGYDKRTTKQDANQNLQWLAGKRADLEKSKWKNERWLAAEVEKEKVFPAAELKKLRGLRRLIFSQK
jgi:hypothetical protein